MNKMVVKVLWADVIDEQAQSGLIVTTSSLSQGAGKNVLQGEHIWLNKLNLVILTSGE